MIGERREVHFLSEPPRDKSIQLAKTSSLQGRPKQYAHRKQPAVKKGSWQQDDNWCGRRTRYLPPPRGRQEEAVIPSKSLAPSDGDKKKAISLNHLLNFTVTPRDTAAYSSSTRRKSKSTPSFNKEQFLQANCQFVVKHSGDYSVHLANPDLLVEWDCIEQVRLFCHQIPSCPICLYPPRVAKITHCGHVYCWSCVLHYLSLSDKAWRKCPICYESIYKDDLKSVSTIMSSQQYKAGDTITMWLMSRLKDGTIVTPKSFPVSKGLLPTVDDKIPTQFYKLLTATPDQVLNQIISVEKAALLTLLKSLSAEEESERCFIDCCLEELEKREKLITGAKAAYDHARDIDTVSTEPDTTPAILHVARDDNFIEGPYEQAFSDAEDEVNSSTLDSSSCSHSSIDSEDFTKDKTEFHPSSSTEQTDSCYTYFYQASDGQHLYLHPINAHCLVKEYGSLVSAPLEIKARIVEMEQLGMNHDTHSKYRYLSHLPVTCQFVLCELDLKPPVVSRNTLSHFAAQLHKRRQLRQKKKHKENQMKYKAENGSSSLPDLQHRQQISPEKFHNLLSLASSPPLSSHVTTQLSPAAQEFVPGKVSHDTLPAATVPVSQQSSTPSFAQALSKGEKKADVRFPAVKVTTPPKGPAVEVLSDDDEVVPTFQDSFVDALAQATENMQIANQGTSGKPGGSKTAKKGRKKMVLFSTGTQRRSN